jgi:S1-C subfamily serine protease
MREIVRAALLFGLMLVFIHAPAESEQQGDNEVARPQSALTKAIKQVGPSVVQIGVVFTHLPERTKKYLEETHPDLWRHALCAAPCMFFDQPLGTGFLVNEDGYVITAQHVVDDLHTQPRYSDGQGPLDFGQGRATVRIQSPNVGEIGLSGSAEPPGPTTRGAFYGAEFEEVGEDTIHDLALLKLKYNPFTIDAVLKTPKGDVKIVPVKSAKFSLARPEEGEPIAVSGYPLSSAVLVSTSGAIASSWRVDQKDLPLGAPGAFTSHLSDLYLADMHVNHGNSGGPVYSLEDGSVIGVCVSFLKDSLDGREWYNSGLSLMIPAKYVVELLRKNHLKWTATNTSP